MMRYDEKNDHDPATPSNQGLVRLLDRIGFDLIHHLQR